MKDENGLENICREIFSQLEKGITKSRFDTQNYSEIICDRERVVDEYFRQISIERECSGKTVADAHYSELAMIVKQEFLPAYDIFRKRKVRIQERQANRNIWRYAIGTIIVMNVIEAVMSKGMSLRPQIIALTCVFEGALGYVIYGIQQNLDNLRIGRAKHKLFANVRRIDKKFVREKRYDTFCEVMDGDLMQAEAASILSKYHSSDEFWSDYAKVRDVDPVDKANKNMLNCTAFDEFLEMHVNGSYSKEKREKRFNDLFLFAHNYFLAQDKHNYVKNQLEGRGRG